MQLVHDITVAVADAVFGSDQIIAVMVPAGFFQNFCQSVFGDLISVNLRYLFKTLQVGIQDINNFNYLFKKKVGLTPIQYRNSTDFIL